MSEGSLVSRRGFVAGAVGAGCMVALGGVKYLPDGEVCRPPGAQDENRFIGACIRCGKCIEVCPNSCIAPSGVEDGIINIRAPKLDFSRSASQLHGAIGWCDHCAENNNGVAKCAEVCPSGALSLDDDSTFETMRLGVAVIEQDWCLAWMLKGCTLCKNACPMDAITFDNHNRPHVDQSLCNGCGSCEQACVSLESVSMGAGGRSVTSRAITVHPVGSEAVLKASGEANSPISGGAEAAAGADAEPAAEPAAAGDAEPVDAAAQDASPAEGGNE